MSLAFMHLRVGADRRVQGDDLRRGFLHRLRVIWRCKSPHTRTNLHRRARLRALPRFGKAPKAEAVGADVQVVRRKLVVLLLLLACSSVGWTAEPGTIIHKRVSEVRLTVVATDENGRPVSNLSPTDITVLEDGRPVPRFELRPSADLRLRVGVVLDLSESTRKSWTTVRTALTRSLQDVMGAEDELLVIAFNSKIELDRTVAQPSDLAAVLGNPASGGLTALYDTIFRVCGHPVFAGDDPHRSALILFSDGEDDLSIHGLGDAIAQAQRAGIAIYTVTTHNPKKFHPGDEVLRDLAASTGGLDFVVKDAAQLERVLAKINGELRSSYLLYYRASEEPGMRAFRRVRVIPNQSDGARVRSRAGYFTTP